MRDRVYVGGTFDLFHSGHVNLLRRAAEYGDVYVALNTDEFAARYKRRPILTIAERTILVLSCRYVYDVLPNLGAWDSKFTIARVGPRYIVHGDDWTGKAYLEQLAVTEEWLEQRGIELLYLPYTDGISSSDIEERVRARDVHGCRHCTRGEPAQDPREPAVPDEEARRDPVLHVPPAPCVCLSGCRLEGGLPDGQFCRLR